MLSNFLLKKDVKIYDSQMKLRHEKNEIPNSDIAPLRNRDIREFEI